LDDSHRAHRPQLCAGCGKPPGLSIVVIAAMGRTAPMCTACAQRAQDSTVFGATVARCVAGGFTLPETEASFAAAGLRLPHTEVEARNVWTELVRRFEAETGCKAPSIEAIVSALMRGVAR
jgi:hypothetical protein